MNRLYSIMLLLCPFMAHAVFNPTAGTPLWNIAAETGIIASAIEGTQTRIQQSDLSGGTYTISSPGRYAVVENLTAPALATTINITASNVYLDLNGFTINGAGGGANIIDATSGTSNIYIGNGVLINAPSIGVNIRNNTTNVVLENIQATNSSSGVGFQIQDTNTCFLINCATANNATAGASLNTVERVIINNFSSDADAAIGISLLDSSNVQIKDVSIFASGTHGISFSGTTSAVSLENFEIFEPASNGINIASGIFAICIENGCIIHPASDAVNLAGNNEDISIINVNVNNADNGFAFGDNCINIILDGCLAEKCLSAGFTATDMGNSSWLNCSSDFNGSNGFSIDSTGTNNTDFRNQNILIDSCTAKGNGLNGFVLGQNNQLSVCTLQNCVALQNGGSDFTPSIGFNFLLTLVGSTIKNNIAEEGGIANFQFQDALSGNTGGLNQIIDNIGRTSSNNAGSNFVDGNTNANIYLANFASSNSGVLTNNYLFTGGSPTVPTITVVSGTLMNVTTDLTRWTNISATP